MKLQVKARSGRVLISSLTVRKDASVDSLQKSIHAELPSLYPSRQRLTLLGKPGKPTVLEAGTSVSEYALKDGDTVILKDLGPQIGWTTVFLIEYAGPAVIYPLFYFFPKVLLLALKVGLTDYLTDILPIRIQCKGVLGKEHCSNGHVVCCMKSPTR